RVHQGGSHVRQDGGPQGVQGHGLEGVQTHGDQQGGGAVVHRRGLADAKAAQGGGGFLGEGAVHLAAAQEAGAELGGGVPGGELGVQHGVDARQGVRHHLVKGVGGAGRRGLLGQAAHLGGLVLVRKGEGGGVVEGDGGVAEVEHLVLEMVGQLLVGEGGLALLAVDQVDEGGLLGQVVFVVADGVLPDAVGGVEAAVVLQQLVGVAVSLGGVGGVQLAAQLGKPGFHRHIAAQLLQGGLGHKVADGDGLAPVGGDGRVQKGFDAGGVLVLSGV